MSIKRMLVCTAAVALLMACQETLEERAAREAREMTESKCPMPVGDNMMLDSIVFDIPTITQSQYFRFIGDSDNDSVMLALKDAKAVLVNELKNTPVYKSLMDRGTNFRYVYRSDKQRDKVYLETVITPDDYNR